MSTHHDDAMLDLVYEYALGSIDAKTGECARVREHLATCPVCQEEFEIARGATAALSRSAEQAPPPGLRSKVLAATSTRGPASVISVTPRRRAAWVVPAAAAVAVLIAVAMWWNNHREPARQWAGSCVADVAHCQATAIVTQSRSGMHVSIVGLAPLPAGRQYQAWVIPAGGLPKAEPAFSPDPQGSASIDIPEAPQLGAVVALTVEPRGGSQKPTTHPFLIAKID